LESDIENMRSKLSGLAGVSLSDPDVVELLAEIIGEGGGVLLEIDDGTRYRLLRREGKFVLNKDASRARYSSVPPRK
jgi:hypothetical protein